MAQKKHKKRRRDTRTEEQKAQSARDIALATEQAEQAKKKVTLSRSKDKNVEKSKNKVAAKGSDGKAAKPGIFRRFINYCKEVKSEMQRVVWPTRAELVNASLIVIGALVFFGVYIAIIDNIIIIPLDAIASLGVNANG